MESWMTPHPGFYARMFVRRIVVYDEMQVEFRHRFGINLGEETNELLMPVAGDAFTDDFTVKHAQSSE